MFRKRETGCAPFAGSNIGELHLPFGNEHTVGIDAETSLTFVQTAKKEMIADEQLPIETGSDAKRTDLYGTPHIADGKERAFLLTMRSHHAVRTIGAIAVEDYTFLKFQTIGTQHGLIAEAPDKAAGKIGRSRPLLPIVFKSGTCTTVVLRMQELGGHKHLVTIHQTPRSRIIAGIMMRIHAVPVLPGMNDMTLLEIKFRKTIIQLRIPSPFITIGPNEDARMILVGNHLLPQEFFTRRRIIATMPSAELIEIENAQRVADIEEMTVG